MSTQTAREAPAPTTGLFTPKLVTVFREGYRWAGLRADIIAGLTVAIVALPLSMAIAVASGTSPEKGLYASIVGGFFVSLLSGSRFQIGGPAGAFIVIVASIVQQKGYEGLLVASLMAGAMLIAIGLLRIGTYIRYIPHAVIIGFTSGIALIIFASQIHDALGLHLPGKEPGALIPKIAALWAAAGTLNPVALGITAAVVVGIVTIRRLRPGWPGMLLVTALAAIATAAFHLPVETIGSRFGGIPDGLPMPALPTGFASRALDMLPDAMTIALLAGIESLLSAVVADGMTGRRHRSNCELVAQGTANIASALFGGLPITGLIARTATNVRAGAVGPVSGIVHSAALLAVMVVAAPLASSIPLAALAGVLIVVAWSMAEAGAFADLLRRSRGDAAVLLVTFLLTVFRDLTEGIAAGIVLGSLVFMHRMAQIVSVDRTSLDERIADQPDTGREAYDSSDSMDRDIIIYRIAGPLFFGATTALDTILSRIGERPRAFILDISAAPFADAEAAATLKAFAMRAGRHGTHVYIAGAVPAVRHALTREGLRPPAVRYAADAAAARSAALAELAQDVARDA